MSILVTIEVGASKIVFKISFQVGTVKYLIEDIWKNQINISVSIYSESGDQSVVI